MTAVVLALGSNLGDRAANLQRAVAELQAAGVAITAESSVWETGPVPVDQPRFFNAVVCGETNLEPESLLELLKRIEWGMGRRPTRHWGPRVIDIDILLFGDNRFESSVLTIPHPGLAERGFVLAPLAEVVGGQLPVLGKTANELLAEAGTEGLEKTEIRLR